MLGIAFVWNTSRRSGLYPTARPSFGQLRHRFDFDRAEMSRPRVALNGRFSGTLQPTGTQTVAFHLFDAIVRAPRTVELVIFADDAFPGVADWADIPGTELVPVPFSKWRRASAQLWVQFALSQAARQRGCALAHHPSNDPPRLRGGIRHLVTVHDLNFLHHPEWFGRKFRLWLCATAVPGVRAADHVVTISDYVLRDVRDTLGVSTERSSRIYNGTRFDSNRIPPALASSTKQIILGVNLWQPHKNLFRLIDAFTQLRKELPHLELHLVGRPQANFRRSGEMSTRIEAPGVRLLGYLSDEELVAAYVNASVFAYPSLAEGFGLPILEAMALGTPVMTSNTTSLPEIAGGAAVLVDPRSGAEISAGLRRLLSEGVAERAARVAAGKRVAARFCWNAAAKSYLELYEQLLSDR